MTVQRPAARMYPDVASSAFPERAAPFAAFVAGLRPQSPLCAAITAACRRPEPECLLPLLRLAALSPEQAPRVEATARTLVTRLRARTRSGRAKGLIHEYSLSSQEGVALMCLAKALLRIPDWATREALIRDEIAAGDWGAHVGHSPSLFVNAATWGLVVTGPLTATTSESGLSASLTRLIGRGGEPVVRKGFGLAMRMMGEQFVTGQTIIKALANAHRMEARDFRAAMTAEDAARYLAACEGAIHAIGKASAGRGVVEGPGISVKLSALHPRYSRAKRDRVMAEPLPRLGGLALLAKRYGIGLNIDAEEAGRLELSLDLLETLALDPALVGWDGIGFVMQAYGKRCPFVIDWPVDLARRSACRIMVRLMKGAYWDSEIKGAQVDGMPDFPVYTCKLHTDVSYLCCARKLLAATDAVFPQFATHNAQTLATITEMAAPGYRPDQYEFQCLHGMGEPLYEEVVGPGRLDRPCRICAPVGTHESLLAYLVRRLLENGASFSFVNRIADDAVPVDELVADPVALVCACNPSCQPYERIALPRELYGAGHANSMGLDLSNEDELAALAEGVQESARTRRTAQPAGGSGVWRTVLNPADHRDLVGEVMEAAPGDVEAALAAAATAAPGWAAMPALQHAACLRRATDAMEARIPVLVGLISREAGKSFANAVSEVREAFDLLRYYAEEVTRTAGADRHAPWGRWPASRPGTSRWRSSPARSRRLGPACP